VLFFDVGPDDISRLSDSGLRELIGRLCEAELVKVGHTPSHVTFGGDQNAGDGGIDVRVALPEGAQITGFIPRANTGFQVKRQDMPRSAILEEMRPHGQLRPAIVALAKQGGAYVIASALGSASDSSLQNRRAAMAEATAGTPEAHALHLNFYDRTSLASWAREHPAVVLWLRSKVGRQISGWRTYGQWTRSTTDTYLIDDEVRILHRRGSVAPAQTAEQGISALRDVLNRPRGIARLVGLSGVGKTRLVQALFDDRVGIGALPRSLAIYADLADSPEPQPVALASQLIETRTRAIMVVDNSPPDLHSRLSELCRQQESQLSLLTVEYDIREDLPESTEVFKLEPASVKLIEKLLSQEFGVVSSVDARKIAEFSGGNARIAFALAEMVRRNGTLVGVSDEALFQRLFHQRHAEDQSLYFAAQACSLVYSFDGANVDDHGDLARLGRIIGTDASSMYRYVAELRRRDLVQQRSMWRAVLPQAIAIRLAGTALENFPYRLIEEHVLHDQRLLRSFSRRLGQLNTSPKAIEIADRWLSTNGLLADICKLNELGKTLLINIAPCAPDKLLAVLESAIQEGLSEADAGIFADYLDLLRLIAYDADKFERCTELMIRVLVAREIDDRAHALEIFLVLFRAIASGTHATVDQRVRIIEKLLQSSVPRRRQVGVLALREALRAGDFWVHLAFDFGARSRDHGYWPRSSTEYKQWFAEVLSLVEQHGQPSKAVAHEVRHSLVLTFRDIWRTASAPDEVARAIHSLNAEQYWPEIWIAVRQTLRFDGEDMHVELREELQRLEKALRPSSILQRVDAIVLSDDAASETDDDVVYGNENFSRQYERAREIAEKLGVEVAKDKALFGVVAPKSLTKGGKTLEFGKGLAVGASDPALIWHKLLAATKDINQELIKPFVLRGFLLELHRREPDLVSRLLDDLLSDDAIPWLFPDLQAMIPIDQNGLQRLKTSLVRRSCPANGYRLLAFGGTTNRIPPADLRELVLSIADLEGGFPVAVEILHARFRGESKSEEEIPPELLNVGCELLEKMPLAPGRDLDDLWLGELAAMCLRSTRGEALASSLCQTLRAAITHGKTHASSHDDLLIGLFEAQPRATLDALMGETEDDHQAGFRILREMGWRKDLLGYVEEEVLVAWCDGAPSIRYPMVAGAIQPTRHDQSDEVWKWSRIANLLLNHAPEPGEVLSRLVDRLTDEMGGFGSLAAKLESQSRLLDDLEGNPRFAPFLLEVRSRLRTQIEYLSKMESADDRARHERFE
jgi:hypothetical protein